jgi:thiol-disulfide isomerase/thioredoxin
MLRFSNALMGVVFGLSALVASTAGFAKDNEVCSAYELRVYTTTWCHPCQMLHKVLEDNKKDLEAQGHKGNDILVKIGNLVHDVPVTMIDVTNMKEEEMRKAGMKGQYVPEIQVRYHEGEPLAIDSGFKSLDQLKDMIRTAAIKHQEDTKKNSTPGQATPHQLAQQPTGSNTPAE